MGFGQPSTDLSSMTIENGTEDEFSYLVRPSQPSTQKESGLSSRVIESLVLKTIKQEGAMTEPQLGDFLKVASYVFREHIQDLLHRELLDTPAPQTYDLTNKGRELTRMYEDEDAYVGPAPVPFAAYREMVVKQASYDKRITQDDMDRCFASFPMRQELLRVLKEGFNSQRVIIFWGPPGNGKSLVTDNLHRLLDFDVLLPVAFEFNNKVIQYYDPAFHHLSEDVMAAEEEAAKQSVTGRGKPDRRWLVSRPPLVTVGTEFRVEHFEISYDGKYDAPPHVKANNGIFIFDDLGRQTQDHNMILNQFIYPLEQQECIIKFTGGSSIRVPYRQRLFLSTNLNFKAIIDDAFARRLLYQVLVDRPTDALWKQIVVNTAKKHNIDEEFSKRLARMLLGWYKRDGRVIRAADPRNVFIMLDATLLEGEALADKLTVELFERIYHQYPPAFEKDAVGYADIVACTDEEFRDLTIKAGDEYGTPRQVTEEIAKQLYSWFIRDGRFPLPNDPGNIFAVLDGEVAEGSFEMQNLTVAQFERVYKELPMYTEADAKRAMSSFGVGGK